MKLKKLKANKRVQAFSLIELVVVIVVLGILALIVTLSYSGIRQKTITTAIKDQLTNDHGVLSLYKTFHDSYPIALDSKDCALMPIASDGYCLENLSEGASLTYVGTATGFSLTISSIDFPELSFNITETGKITQSNDMPLAVRGFIKTWGGSGDDSGMDGDTGALSSLVQTDDGGYITVGTTTSFGSGDYDAFITRYTENGDIVWTKTWGGSDFDSATSVTKLNDGNFILYGYTGSYGVKGTNESGQTITDAFIAKYTPEGSLLWSKTWGGVGFEWSNGVISESNGGFIITGSTESFNAPSSNSYVVKYDNDGNIIWSKYYDFTYVSAIAQMSDGNYVIAGNCWNSSNSSYDSVLTKISSSGVVLWSKTWGGNGSKDKTYSITNSSDGGFVIAGMTNSFGSGYYNAFIAKYTVNGDLIWTRVFGGTDNEWVNSIIQSIDGGYVAVGTSFSFDTEGMFIVKYNNYGNLVWFRTIGGDDYEKPAAVIQANDGGYAVTGVIKRNGANNYDSFTAKLNSEGLMLNCLRSVCKNISNAESLNVSVSSIVQTVNSYNAVGIISGFTAFETVPDVIEVLAYPIPPPAEPTVLLTDELRVLYSGEDKEDCKEWSADGGNTIKSFYLNYETELNYDYIDVYADNVDVYNGSGLVEGELIDISSSPAAILKICLTTDSANQDGFGGEVTGVFY